MVYDVDYYYVVFRGTHEELSGRPCTFEDDVEMKHHFDEDEKEIIEEFFKE